MSQAILCFRTVVRSGFFRQARSQDGKNILIPIGIAVPPTNTQINPGEDLEEAMETAVDGTDVISLSYIKGRKAEFSCDFGMATAEVESFIHGRLPALLGNSNKATGQVLAEFLAEATEVPARAASEVGYGVAAQGVNSKAYGWYINPETKLSVPMEVVASNSADPLTMNQFKIDEHFKISISADLAETGYEVRIWCPCEFSKGTITSAESLGLVTIFMMGINFNGTARTMTIRNCSRLPGSEISSEPKRSCKFRILPDPNDGTGLGWSMIDTDQRMVA